MKGKPRMLWRLYPSYLIITLFCLVAVSLYASSIWKDFFLSQTSQDLAARARLFSRSLEELDSPLAPEAVEPLCRKAGAQAGTRLTVILPNGRVAGDSEENPSLMDNHADRPEVRAALGGAVGQSIRYSRTLDRDMMYVAVPLKHGPRLIAVVRASVPLNAISAAVSRLRTRMAWAAVILALAAALISFLVSRRISRPVAEMREGAQRFAAGELSHRLPEPETAEMASLADALNRMAEELSERISLVRQQTAEYQAVLASMREGIIAVSPDFHVIQANAAVGRMLDLNEPFLAGRSLQELVRNRPLFDLVQKTLESREPAQKDIPLLPPGERTLNVTATLLDGPGPDPGGVLLVLSDVTRLRRLENLRRDFAANVSHEIRTPLAAIRAASETLCSGALKEPEEAERFAHMIVRNADRLQAIVDDLLQLASMEKENGAGPGDLEPASLGSLIRSAASQVEESARARNIKLSFDCPEDLNATMNLNLMEQALVNLLQNAVQYSPDAGNISVSAKSGDGYLTLSVSDQGPGIPPEHIPRLFERFYRVDPARSRKMGGTGLGLAIVKHIAQAHGGTASVESTPGRGSTFIIRFPEKTAGTATA